MAYLCLLALLEERLLGGLVLNLIAGKVLGLRNLVELGLVQTFQLNLERSGDHVARVDPAERDTVDLERAGNEEGTLVEVLQEDDTLAPEATGEEDQDGARLQRLPRGPRADSLADLFR